MKTLPRSTLAVPRSTALSNDPVRVTAGTVEMSSDARPGLLIAWKLDARALSENDGLSYCSKLTVPSRESEPRRSSIVSAESLLM